MSLAPPHLLGTVGAGSSLARNLGFAVGPALAVGAWSAAGYRLAGMRIGTALAVAVVLAGAIALAGRRRRVPEPSDQPTAEVHA